MGAGRADIQALMRMFRRDRRAEEAARQLYAEIVEQARRPQFYLACGVPDTLDGRFEMVGLHLFLMLRRLRRARAENPAAEPLAQALFDVTFANMDESLREMGVGDLAVGGRVKRMAAAVYGRIAAYERGLDAPDGVALGEALRRNLYGTVQPDDMALAAMADYLRREDAGLMGQSADGLLAGRVTFGPPPVREG